MNIWNIIEQEYAFVVFFLFLSRRSLPVVVFCEKGVLKNFKYSQVNTCVGVSILYGSPPVAASAYLNNNYHMKEIDISICLCCFLIRYFIS